MKIDRNLFYVTSKNESYSCGVHCQNDFLMLEEMYLGDRRPQIQLTELDDFTVVVLLALGTFTL